MSSLALGDTNATHRANVVDWLVLHDEEGLQSHVGEAVAAVVLKCGVGRRT